MKKGQNGITLIALVITIIVLIILAAVSINGVMNGGLIETSKKAAFISEIEKLEEQIKIYKYVEEVEKHTNSGSAEGDDNDSKEETDYSSFVSDRLKGIIDTTSDGELLFTGNPNSEEAIWAKELGIVSKGDYTLKKNLGELVDLAKQYVADGKSQESPNSLALQYIRRNRYTGGNWTTLAGEVDTTFVTYVNENKSTSLDITDFKDPVTGEEIDFVHSMASLNVYIEQASSSDPIKQYACWAGDLCTFTEEIYQYYKSGTYTEEQLKEYTKSMLGGPSTFGLADMLADADAVNISQLIKSGGDLDDVIYSYYYENDSAKCKNRYADFATYLKARKSSATGTDQEKLYAVAWYYLGNHNEFFAWVEIYASELIDSYSSVPDVVFETVSTCFAEFIVERM